MIFNIYLLCFIVLFFGTINTLPVYRHRRQINSQKTGGLYDRPSARTSGSIKGTYYYGIGSDPNYGSYISRPNSAHSNGLVPISYNSNSNLYGNLIKPNYIHQQQQRQDYMYNNNRNKGWQRQNMNNNYNSYSNRYPPGSQGRYATGVVFGQGQGTLYENGPQRDKFGQLGFGDLCWEIEQAKDDFDYLDSLLNYMMNKYDDLLDIDRIYFMGYSNGA